MKKRTEGLSVFLVDMHKAKGLSIKPIRTMMNHATTEVFFDDLRVPAENLIGEEGQGFRYILSGMNAERILIASECIGDAKWFIEKASAYAKERVLFGRPIGQNQGVQFPIAKAYAQMRASELMVQEAATLYAAGKDCGAEANMAKMLAADASWAAADMCVRRTHWRFRLCRKSSTSNAGSARRGNIRSRRSRRIWMLVVSGRAMCSACRGRISLPCASARRSLRPPSVKYDSCCPVAVDWCSSVLAVAAFSSTNAEFSLGQMVDLGERLVDLVEPFRIVRRSRRRCLIRFQHTLLIEADDLAERLARLIDEIDAFLHLRRRPRDEVLDVFRGLRGTLRQ